MGRSSTCVGSAFGGGEIMSRAQRAGCWGGMAARGVPTAARSFLAAPPRHSPPPPPLLPPKLKPSHSKPHQATSRQIKPPHNVVKVGQLVPSDLLHSVLHTRRAARGGATCSRGCLAEGRRRRRGDCRQSTVHATHSPARREEPACCILSHHLSFRVLQLRNTQPTWISNQRQGV